MLDEFYQWFLSVHNYKDVIDFLYSYEMIYEGFWE